LPSISVYQTSEEELLKVEIAGPFTGHPAIIQLSLKTARGVDHSEFL